MAYTSPTATSPAASMGGHVAQFVLDSVGSTGLVTSPAAGQTITWLQAPQNGRYSVQLMWGGGATGPLPLGGVKPNNIRLQVDATTVTSLLMLAATSGTYAATAILTVTAENWVALNVIAADAGATYVGSLILSRLG